MRDVITRIKTLRSRIRIIRINGSHVLRTLAIINTSHFRGVHILLGSHFFYLVVSKRRAYPTVVCVLQANVLRRRLAINRQVRSVIRVFVRARRNYGIVRYTNNPLLFRGKARVEVSHDGYTKVRHFRASVNFRGFTRMTNLLRLLTISRTSGTSPFKRRVRDAVDDRTV